MLPRVVDRGSLGEYSHHCRPIRSVPLEGSTRPGASLLSIVKSLAVGNGDMFYIRHNSDNFSVIDCSLPGDRKNEILDEITEQSSGRKICRFISTHPD